MQMVLGSTSFARIGLLPFIGKNVRALLNELLA